MAVNYIFGTVNRLNERHKFGVSSLGNMATSEVRLEMREAAKNTEVGRAGMSFVIAASLVLSTHNIYKLEKETQFLQADTLRNQVANSTYRPVGSGMSIGARPSLDPDVAEKLAQLGFNTRQGRRLYNKFSDVNGTGNTSEQMRQISRESRRDGVTMDAAKIQQNLVAGLTDPYLLAGLGAISNRSNANKTLKKLEKELNKAVGQKTYIYGKISTGLVDIKAVIRSGRFMGKNLTPEMIQTLKTIDALTSASTVSDSVQTDMLKAHYASDQNTLAQIKPLNMNSLHSVRQRTALMGRMLKDQGVVIGKNTPINQASVRRLQKTYQSMAPGNVKDELGEYIKLRNLQDKLAAKHKSIRSRRGVIIRTLTSPFSDNEIVQGARTVRRGYQIGKTSLRFARGSMHMARAVSRSIIRLVPKPIRRAIRRGTGILSNATKRGLLTAGRATLRVTGRAATRVGRAVSNHTPASVKKAAQAAKTTSKKVANAGKKIGRNAAKAGRKAARAGGKIRNAIARPFRPIGKAFRKVRARVSNSFVRRGFGKIFGIHAKFRQIKIWLIKAAGITVAVLLCMQVVIYAAMSIAEAVSHIVTAVTDVAHGVHDFFVPWNKYLDDDQLERMKVLLTDNISQLESAYNDPEIMWWVQDGLSDKIDSNLYYFDTQPQAWLDNQSGYERAEIGLESDEYKAGAPCTYYTYNGERRLITDFSTVKIAAAMADLAVKPVEKANDARNLNKYALAIWSYLHEAEVTAFLRVDKSAGVRYQYYCNDDTNLSKSAGIGKCEIHNYPDGTLIEVSGSPDLGNKETPVFVTVDEPFLPYNIYGCEYTIHEIVYENHKAVGLEKRYKRATAPGDTDKLISTKVVNVNKFNIDIQSLKRQFGGGLEYYLHPDICEGCSLNWLTLGTSNKSKITEHSPDEMSACKNKVRLVHDEAHYCAYCSTFNESVKVGDTTYNHLIKDTNSYPSIMYCNNYRELELNGVKYYQCLGHCYGHEVCLGHVVDNEHTHCGCSGDHSVVLDSGHMEYSLEKTIGDYSKLTAQKLAGAHDTAALTEYFKTWKETHEYKLPFEVKGSSQRSLEQQALLLFESNDEFKRDAINALGEGYTWTNPFPGTDPSYEVWEQIKQLGSIDEWERRNPEVSRYFFTDRTDYNDRITLGFVRRGDEVSLGEIQSEYPEFFDGWNDTNLSLAFYIANSDWYKEYHISATEFRGGQLSGSELRSLMKEYRIDSSTTSVFRRSILKKAAEAVGAIEYQKGAIPKYGNFDQNDFGQPLESIQIDYNGVAHANTGIDPLALPYWIYTSVIEDIKGDTSSFSAYADTIKHQLLSVAKLSSAQIQNGSSPLLQSVDKNTVLLPGDVIVHANYNNREKYDDQDAPTAAIVIGGNIIRGFSGDGYHTGVYTVIYMDNYWPKLDTVILTTGTNWKKVNLNCISQMEEAVEQKDYLLD